MSEHRRRLIDRPEVAALKSKYVKKRSDILEKRITQRVQNATPFNFAGIFAASIPLLIFTALQLYREAEEHGFSFEDFYDYHFRKSRSGNEVDLTDVDAVVELGAKVFPNGYQGKGIHKRKKLYPPEFNRLYDAKWPVIVTEVVNSWRARNWTGDFFKSYYGDEKVTMKRVRGKLKTAFGLIVTLEKFYHRLSDVSENKWSYVEDETFFSRNPELTLEFGNLPYTQSNLFASFPEELQPWDLMLLWGSAYSRSPLHVDPYNWTGINVVLKGRKHWKMYPPGQDAWLYAYSRQKSGFPLPTWRYDSPIDAFDFNLTLHPDFRKADALEFVQMPGEVLFIPPGWFHQAYNPEETIAVSMQLMNENNCDIVLEEIFKAGHVDKMSLPHDFKIKSSQEKVEIVMNMIPIDVKTEAKQTKENILKQVMRTH